MTATANAPKTGMTRAERVAQIQALQREGLTSREIAKRIGLSYSFVREIITDPDSARRRARLATYQGACVTCGAPTWGGNGYDNKAARCFSCQKEHEKAVLKVWTRDRIIEAIQRFAREHGRPPIARDWQTAGRGTGYPPAGAVYQRGVFTSWSDAIMAAGFPRPRIGRPPGRSVAA